MSVIAFASLRVRRDAIDDVRESLRDGVCIDSAAATPSTRRHRRGTRRVHTQVGLEARARGRLPTAVLLAHVILRVHRVWSTIRMHGLAYFNVRIVRVSVTCQ